MFCSFNFLTTLFFSGAYLACFSCIFYLFCGWVKIIKGRMIHAPPSIVCPFISSDPCNSVFHGYPEPKFWTFGHPFFRKKYTRILGFRPKHLSEFKFTSDCRFKLFYLRKPVWIMIKRTPRLHLLFFFLRFLKLPIKFLASSWTAEVLCVVALYVGTPKSSYGSARFQCQPKLVICVT